MGELSTRRRDTKTRTSKRACEHQHDVAVWNAESPDRPVDGQRIRNVTVVEPSNIHGGLVFSLAQLERQHAVTGRRELLQGHVQSEERRHAPIPRGAHDDCPVGGVSLLAAKSRTGSSPAKELLDA